MGFKVVRLVNWQMNDGTEFGSEYDQGPLAWLIEFSHHASIGKFLVFEASPPKIKPSPYKKTLKNANDSFQPLEKKPLPLTTFISNPPPPPVSFHIEDCSFTILPPAPSFREGFLGCFSWILSTYVISHLYL